MSTGPDWSKITDDEHDLCVEIANRVQRESTVPIADKGSLIMDLEAAHLDCNLRLADLLEADDFNFAHDIGGIVRHMDRTTGKIGGHFLPRFARPATAAAASA